MISRAELIKQISGPNDKTKVLALSRILKEQQFSLRDLIDIAFIQSRERKLLAALESSSSTN
jgi:hypothetical protein